jgi:tRNA A37 threonylcarbamoyltransferase TsaD
MITLTKPQRKALYRKWKQDSQGKNYRQFRTTVQPQLCGDGAVMVAWSGMWLGIEPDGYTHS